MCSTHGADGVAAGSCRRVRGACESRGCAVGRVLAGGCGAGAAGRVRLVRAAGASVRERCAWAAGGCGGAGAHGGVHGQVGAVVDRWSSRQCALARSDVERGDGGGGACASRPDPRAVDPGPRRCWRGVAAWQGGLRSSSSATGSPVRDWRRRTRSWCPSGAA